MLIEEVCEDGLQYCYPFCHYKMATLRVCDYLGPAGWTMLESSIDQQFVAGVFSLIRPVRLLLRAYLSVLV